MSAAAIESRNDFRTDTQPSLFIDNWGLDVVATHGDKINRQIDAAVELAQVLSSIRTGEPLQPDELDTAVLNGAVFFDGSGKTEDHFFFIEMRPRFQGGSYREPRVSVTFNTGFQRHNSSGDADPSDPTDGSYDMPWSTLRGDIIAARPASRFEQDLARIIRATQVLQELDGGALPTERPETWPGVIRNQEAYQAGADQRFVGPDVQIIYVGSEPLHDVGPEPARKIHIPTLDG